MPAKAVCEVNCANMSARGENTSRPTNTQCKLFAMLCCLMRTHSSRASGFFTAFITAFMIAGCAVQFGGNRSSSDVAANDDQAEFDVYTYMLRTVGTAQYTIVADSTLSRRIPARSTCTQPEQTDCVPSSSHAIEAWRDYLKKNEIRRAMKIARRICFATGLLRFTSSLPSRPSRRP